MSNPQLPTPSTAFSFSQHPPSNNVSLLFTFRRRRVLAIWTRREDGRTRRPKDDESVDDVCFLLKKDDAFCLVAFSKKTITMQKSYAVVGGGVAATFLR